MVLFSPLAHAILHDARDAFHTKQRFIQTVTTGTTSKRVTRSGSWSKRSRRGHGGRWRKRWCSVDPATAQTAHLLGRKIGIVVAAAIARIRVISQTAVAVLVRRSVVCVATRAIDVAAAGFCFSGAGASRTIAVAFVLDPSTRVPVCRPKIARMPVARVYTILVALAARAVAVISFHLRTRVGCVLRVPILACIPTTRFLANRLSRVCSGFRRGRRRSGSRHRRRKPRCRTPSAPAAHPAGRKHFVVVDSAPVRMVQICGATKVALVFGALGCVQTKARRRRRVACRARHWSRDMGRRRRLRPHKGKRLDGTETDIPMAANISTRNTT